MKKLLVIASAVLLLAGSSWANPFMQLMSGSVACDVATDLVGYSGSVGNSVARSLDHVSAVKHTPSCAGKLYTAYIRNYDTVDAKVKVCLYEGGGTDPNGATKVVCSDEIQSSGSGEFSIALGSNPSVSTDTSYWLIAVAGGVNGWRHSYTTDAAYDEHYATITGFYDAPQNTISGTWGSNTGRKYKRWITIGN